MRFFAELRRRKVLPVVVTYGIVAWVVAQGVTLVEEPLSLPEWFDTGIIVLLIAGFPIAVVLAWAYDLTAHGPQRTPPVTEGAASATLAPPTRPEPALLERPQLKHTVRFCTATDGTRLAYATVGAGPPLVKTANWLSHLELDWDSPIYAHMLRDFASAFRLTVYDQRGCGLSDWNAAELSLDKFVSDLESVVDAAGLERFALMGMSQGSIVSIAYAVKHPERVSHLVVLGGFARNFRSAAEVEAVATLIEEGWGKKNPAFRQIFTSTLIPNATASEIEWLNELQRKSTTPAIAARLFRTIHAMDVTGIAPKVKAPTLVAHALDEPGVPLEFGREIAALIPGARFLGLESENHLLLEREPAWAKFRDEMFAFLRGEAGA